MPEDQLLSAETDPFAVPEHQTGAPSRSTYDPSQRELLEPQLKAMNLSLPDDPDSEEFKDLLNRVRQESPALSAAVQGMVRDNTLDENNAIMAAAEKNARRHNAPAENLRKVFMTTNANGEPVFNKNAAMVTAGTLGLLLFAGIAMYNPSSGATTKKTETSDTTGKTVTNPDGTTTTTYPDGSSLTKKPDGSQVVKKPSGEVLTQTPDGVVTTTFPDGHTMVKAADGTSVETLADGSKVTRDAAGNVVSTTPPVDATTPNVPVATSAQSLQATTTGSDTQAAAPLDNGYQSTPPVTGDPYAAGSGAGSAAPPSAAETASGITPVGASGASASGSSADPYAGTPYEAGIYNPTDAEIAAGYTPGKTTPKTQAASGDSGPVMLAPLSSPSAAEAAGGLTSSPSSATFPASVVPGTATAGAQVQTPVPVQLTVYRRGQAQQAQASSGGATAAAGNTSGDAQENGTQGGGNTSTAAGAGGGSGAVAFRKTPIIAVQMLRASSANSAPNGATGGSAAAPASASATSDQGTATGSMIAFKKSSSAVNVTRIMRPVTPATASIPQTGVPDDTQSASSDAPLAASSDTGSAPSSLLAYTARNGSPSDDGAPGDTTLTARGSSSTPAVASPYRLGQRVMAILETGVYVAQGGDTLPVYASTQDGTLWRGTVSLDRTKRVMITFDRAVLRDGTEVEVQAAAYNMDGTPGLKAQYRDIAPTLANDLIRSAVSGVRDYVDAKLQATSTTTSTGGAVTVERQVPTIWESVAGSATGIFQLPTTQNTFVTVAQISVGAQFALVYGPTKTELGNQ